MPRTTLCIPDGPAACSVYELALDGSGNTTGAPAMDEQGDSTRQTTWRPFLSEPATLLHVVNGSRDAAATLAPGYGAEGGSVGPLAINVPDAVDEAHWYVKPLASLPGHTSATSGGPGLPHAPLYVCSGFNRKHGTGDDRTTAPPDAYPLPVASAPGGGDPGSSDGESKASTGPCACSLGNPSVANVASTTDEGTGATKSPAGHWTDPVPAVIYSGFLDISKLVHGADDEEYDFDFPWLPGGILENVIRKLGWKAARACDDVVQDARDAWEESKEKWSGIIERIGNGTASDADWADLGELGSDVGHFLLELVGAMPLPGVSSLADGLNALWYAAEGKYLDAAMSALGAIPVIGDALSGMWVLTRQSIRAASTVADAGKILSSFQKFAMTMAAKMLGGNSHLYAGALSVITGATSAAHYLAGSSKRLRSALLAAGEMAQDGDHAHHIIPKGISGPTADALRKMLADAGVGIDDAANGVFLPACRKAGDTRAGHLDDVHGFNDAYLEALRERLENLKGTEFIDELARINADLKAGKVPGR